MNQNDPIEMEPEIGVGSLVRLRTEDEDPMSYVVVRFPRWWQWWRRGMIRIHHRRDYNFTRPEKYRWVYPCEVELVEGTP